MHSNARGQVIAIGTGKPEELCLGVAAAGLALARVDNPAAESQTRSSVATRTATGRQGRGRAVRGTRRGLPSVDRRVDRSLRSPGAAACPSITHTANLLDDPVSFPGGTERSTRKLDRRREAGSDPKINIMNLKSTLGARSKGQRGRGSERAAGRVERRRPKRARSRRERQRGLAAGAGASRVPPSRPRAAHPARREHSDCPA